MVGLESDAVLPCLFAIAPDGVGQVVEENTHIRFHFDFWFVVPSALCLDVFEPGAEPWTDWLSQRQDVFPVFLVANDGLDVWPHLAHICARMRGAVTSVLLKQSASSLALAVLVLYGPHRHTVAARLADGVDEVIRAVDRVVVVWMSGLRQNSDVCAALRVTRVGLRILFQLVETASLGDAEDGAAVEEVARGLVPLLQRALATQLLWHDVDAVA